MLIELQETYDLIIQALRPEDVYGDIIADDRASRLEQLERINADLFARVDPERYTHDFDARDIATAAAHRLQTFYQSARERILSDRYGQNSPSSGNEIVTHKRSYRLHSTLVEGDLCTVYLADCHNSDEMNGKVVIKVVRDAVDNSFLQRERDVLKTFQANPGKQSKHLPVLLDEFRTDADQIGIVLHHLDGFDLYQVREHHLHKNGVSPKHMVWMLNRLLSVVGFAHSLGIIHGNIEPSHVMVRPSDHNVWLIDWTVAAINPAKTGDSFKVYNEEFCPPEVKQRKPPLPAADIYSIGKCMIFVLGGDITTNKMPTSVPEPLQRFIRVCVLESALQRPQDAWQLHPQLISIVESLWGRRTFIPFFMQ